MGRRIFPENKTVLKKSQHIREGKLPFENKSQVNLVITFNWNYFPGEVQGEVKVPSPWQVFTAWKVSKYGVFSGPYFPAFGLNAEKYGVSLRIQSECGKIQARKNSVFEHFSRYVFMGNLIWWLLIRVPPRLRKKSLDYVCVILSS